MLASSQARILRIMNFYKLTTEKLKELKTWAQIKSPKSLQPVLSYALDWLSPELLGTGFRMMEVSDFAVKGTIPARNANLDFQSEVHHGLVINASYELARAFLQKQMSESFFHITGTDYNFSKKNKWQNDLTLLLETDQATMDDFFINLQKNKNAEVIFEVAIKVENIKKADSVKLTLHVEKVELIS
jgi:hypothetical protein